MLGRGSPRLLLSKAAQWRKSPIAAPSRKDGSSPKGKKHGGSPKGKKHGGSPKGRAVWNPTLEKTLVDLLHEHKTPDYRGQNGWSTDAWTKIVREFHERENYVSFTKAQIQEKEKELKREYKMLKEARKQSGVSWNEKRCMIIAEPAVWANIIITFPKAKKFRNKSFPLFDALGDLYDGHIAEGNYNFTSTQAPIYADLTQVESENVGGEAILDVQSEGEEADASVQPIEVEEVASIEATSVRRSVDVASRNRGQKEPKRQKKDVDDVKVLMGRYIDMRCKQAENEAAQLAKEKEIPQSSDFSIKRCISVLNTLEVTQVEMAKAFGVFKNPDNREIFLSACDANQESALIWLRNEMA